MFKTKKCTIIIVSIVSIILIGFFIQILNSQPDHFYIFNEIDECEKLIPVDKSNINFAIHDVADKDNDLKGLLYNDFFGMSYESEKLKFEIFAYEFEDADSALRYYINVTGQKSYEQKLPLSSSDENKLLSASSGMFSYSLIVVYKNMAYQINAPKQYKNEIIEMLSTTFSIKVM